MFETLPLHFRTFGLKADVRTLLLLQRATEKGLITTLGDIFNVLKGFTIKYPKDIGPFTRAFYAYFLNISIYDNEKLNDAIERSDTFKHWLEDFTEKRSEVMDLEERINAFLDEVHLTSYDIQAVIDGKEIFKNDDPNLADLPQEEGNDTERDLSKIADYSGLTLEEILERMREIAKHQKSKHSGGSHWIGTGGISPYGHGGAAKNGVRVGGSGGGKMARAVLNDRNFYPVDLDGLLNDNSIDAALASLKGIIEESAHDFLDVEATIKEGLKRGGLFLPEIKKITQEKLQVILLIDNGGYSMLYYVKIVRELFKKMKTRFAHDLETYYFHNTVYNEVYSNPNRTQKVTIESILAKDANYRIFIIGDASMASYELSRTSLHFYEELVKKFKKTVWINPEEERAWPYTQTIQMIKTIVPMFPMTPRGIENAVKSMNRINRNG